MTLLEQIQHQLHNLLPEKQDEALDFVNFLQQKVAQSQPSQPQHPAFRSWRERKINALEYEQNLRSEWDERR